MPKLFISGLVNVETTVKVRGFPINYYPIDYPFFGVQSGVSGVGLNLATAAKTLGDEVRLQSMTGRDFEGEFIRQTLIERDIPTDGVLPCLRATPTSVVLYDETGRRQIYCDLKDIQDTPYALNAEAIEDADLIIACNINYNRPLLQAARAAGKIIATDVHVLTDIHDGYNRDFMQAADVLFLSDEGIGEDYQGFLRALYDTYRNGVIVLGRGSKGAALVTDGQILQLPAVQVGPIVNTVGAGDSLFISFLHFYALGMTAVEALVRAELFASAKICVSGGAAGFITETEIQQLYEIYGAAIKNQIQTFPL
jgi:ribokinase